MKRDHYISDHLMDMRERFRQQHQEQQTEPLDAPESSETGETGAVADVSSPILPPPAPRMAERDSSLARERRELEGRVRQDYAQLSAEMESLEQHRRENELFLQALKQVLAAFDTVKTAADLEALYRLYYPAAGRWRGTRPANYARETAVPEYDNRSGRGAVWLLASAVVVGAALIAVVLLLLFA